MPCPTCIRALEQGANAVYELAMFHPELLPAPPTDPSPHGIAEWLARCAGTLRTTANTP